MNKVYDNSSLKATLDESSSFGTVPPLSNGYDPTLDAMIKWCGILDAAKKVCNNPVSILDAGCGPSNLSLALKNVFSSVERVYCLDREPISRLLRSNEICQCFQGDFFEMCSLHVPNESIDLIVDGCSVTHFDTRNDHSPNDGCYRFASEAMRILRPGGIYITCSDFSLDGNSTGEFISVDAMVEAYSKGGLKLLTSNEDNFDLTDPFIANRQLNLGVVRLVFKKEIM
jgi:SAM-dependent methyltransferase